MPLGLRSLLQGAAGGALVWPIQWLAVWDGLHARPTDAWAAASRPLPRAAALPPECSRGHGIAPAPAVNRSVRWVSSRPWA